jgi:hypothetical protein
MHASEVTPEIAANANEFYWGSDRSVNQIAEDLDLSKGALYAALVPLPSGNGCPLCGDEVGWPNRTARDRDQLGCQTCDWSGTTSQTVTYSADDSMLDRPHEAVLIAEDRDAPVVPSAPLTTPRLSMVAGGAILGAAVGLALVLWARRR